MFHLEQHRVTRSLLKSITDQLSDDQLMRIPDLYPNSILWQMGHIVVVQQRLIYGLSGLPLRVSDAYMGWFAPGTSPEDWNQLPDVGQIRADLIDTLDLLEEDAAAGIFKSFDPYLLQGVQLQLNSLEEAIAFNDFHEGVHTGMIMSMRRLV